MNSEGNPSTAKKQVAGREIEIYTRFEKLEKWLEQHLLHKAPFHFDDKWKEIFVKVSPWAVLIGVFFALPFLSLVTGLTLGAAPITVFIGPLGTLISFVSLVLAIGTIAISALSVPGLFKRSKKGWEFAFYAQLGHATIDLLNFQLVGLLLMAISFFFLFQIKYKYVN